MCFFVLTPSCTLQARWFHVDFWNFTSTNALLHRNEREGGKPKRVPCWAPGARCRENRAGRTSRTKTHSYHVYTLQSWPQSKSQVKTSNIIKEIDHLRTLSKTEINELLWLFLITPLQEQNPLVRACGRLPCTILGDFFTGICWLAEHQSCISVLFEFYRETELRKTKDLPARAVVLQYFDRFFCGWWRIFWVAGIETI